MPLAPAHSDEVSQDAARMTVHPSAVPATSPASMPVLDPAARRAKRMYNGLSSSAVGLELGLAVIIALLVGMWLDRKLGSEPWLMLLFLVFGLIAGFRNVVRAVARAEKVEL
jgi:ATP synthase protein I